MTGTNFLWPALPQASAHATQIDWMVAGFSAIVALFTVPIFVLITYFVIKYRHGSSADRSHRPEGNTVLELLWMIIPFTAVLCFFFWAAWSYMDLARPPGNALEINVVAKQWMWKFQHPGGEREINTLHLPTGRAIKLVMISEDVIHSLFLPALRIKQDVLPGRYTTMWFNANTAGIFHLHCTQFCGTDHSLMGGDLILMTPGDYETWLGQQASTATLSAAGEAIYRKMGCGGCHDAGSTVHAPSLGGLYQSPVPLADHKMVTADERYLRDSILLPGNEIAAGYAPIMPSYKGLIPEDNMTALVAYLKALPAQAEARP